MKELLNKTIRRLNAGKYLYVALVVAGVMLITAASKDLYSIKREDAAARSEYDRLRELFYMADGTYAAGTLDAGSYSIGSGHYGADIAATEQEEPRYPGQNSATPDTAADVSEFDVSEFAVPAGALASLAGMNSDFAGWITIAGTSVDYPVVRGDDNIRYLFTTFTGTDNPAGAIFMDHRLTRGFDEPVCVLYGHNMRDGSMFAPLNNYTEPGFMSEHPYINITTAEGGTLVYRVFDVKRTDMRDTTHDPALLEASRAGLAGDSSSGAAPRFLLLSTCTPGADREERTLIYAELVG